MRRYAKDMVAMGKARRQLEKQILQERPELTPAQARKLAKDVVLAAYHNLRNPQNA